MRIRSPGLGTACEVADAVLVRDCEAGGRSPIGRIRVRLAMGSTVHSPWNVVFPKLRLGVWARFISPVTATCVHRAVTPSRAAARVPFVVSLVIRSSNFWKTNRGATYTPHRWSMN
jgi:hypothetical protein